MAAAVTALVLGALTGSPDGGLEVNDHGPSSLRALSPGDAVSWPIGVSVTSVELSELRIQVLGDGSAALEDVLEVSLQGCAEPWRDDRCAAGAFVIAPAASLTQWRQGAARVVSPDGRIPEQVEVLAVVGLADDTPDAVQGERTTVRIGFTAAGLVCPGGGAGCSAAVQPTPGGAGDLPRTGFDLAASLLGGIGAVLLGAGIARWGSKRWGPVAR